MNAISDGYVKKYKSNRKQVLATANASFMKVFKLSPGYKKSSTEDEINEFKENCTRSHVRTDGGSMFR